MSNQQDIKTFRIGNYLDYRGPLGDYPMSRIVDIQLSSGNTLFYSLTHKQKPKGFSGYPSQVSAITLEPHHLKRLGFHLNPKTNIWELMELSMIRLVYATGSDPMAMTGHDDGFHIFNPFAPVPQQKEQITVEAVRENATSVPTLHAFQNYTMDQGRQIDFSVLEP